MPMGTAVGCSGADAIRPSNPIAGDHDILRAGRTVFHLHFLLI